MTPGALATTIVWPTLFWLGDQYASAEAAVMLVAIAGQESRCCQRRQMPEGPARSFWQIEVPTARAVLRKWTLPAALLPELGLDARNVSEWLPWSEVGACMLARGILWLDPHRLPELGDEQGAWACYERCWRPGKPRPETWSEHYEAARGAVSWEART